MPVVRLQLYLQDGEAALSWSDRDHQVYGESLLRPADYRVPTHEQIELELLVNNDDWSYSKPQDGVRFEVSVGGLPAVGKGDYHARLEGRLAWRQVRLLHGFLGMLLAQSETLLGVRDGPEGYAPEPDGAA